MCLSGRKVVTIFQVQAKKLLRKKIVGSNIEQFKLIKVYPSYFKKSLYGILKLSGSLE